MHSFMHHTPRMQPHPITQQRTPAAAASASRSQLQPPATPRVHLPPFAHTAQRPQAHPSSTQHRPMQGAHGAAAAAATGQRPQVQPSSRQPQPQPPPAFISTQWPQPTISSSHRPVQATPRVQPQPQQMQQTPRSMRAAQAPPTPRAAAAVAEGSSSHPIELSPTPAQGFPSSSQEIQLQFHSDGWRTLTINQQFYSPHNQTAETGRRTGGAGAAAAASRQHHVRSASQPSHFPRSFSQPTPRSPATARSPRTPRATAVAATSAAAAPRAPAVATGASSSTGFRPVAPAAAAAASSSSSRRPVARRAQSPDPEATMILVDDPIVSQDFAFPAARAVHAARPQATTAVARSSAFVPVAAATAAASAVPPKSPARGLAARSFRPAVPAQSNKRRAVDLDLDDDFSLGSNHPAIALPRSSRITVPPPPPTTPKASRPLTSHKTPSSKPAAKKRKTTTPWRTPGPHVPFIPRTSPTSDSDSDEEPAPRSGGAAAAPRRVLSPNEPEAQALPAQDQMVDEPDDELEQLAIPAVVADVPPAPPQPPVQRSKPPAASSTVAAMPSAPSHGQAQHKRQSSIPLPQPQPVPPAAQAASSKLGKHRSSRLVQAPSPAPVAVSDEADDEAEDVQPAHRPMRQIRAQELVTREHQLALKQRKAAEHRVPKRAVTPPAEPPVASSPVPPPVRRRRTLIRPHKSDDGEDEDEVMEIAQPPESPTSPVPLNVPVLPPMQLSSGWATAFEQPADAVAAAAATDPPAAMAAGAGGASFAAGASSARPRKAGSAPQANSPVPAMSMSAAAAGLMSSQLSACTISSYCNDAARKLAPPVRGRGAALPASDMDTLLAENVYLPPAEWTDRAPPTPAHTLQDLDLIEDCSDLEEEEQAFHGAITIEAYNKVAISAQNEDVNAALKQCTDCRHPDDEEGNDQGAQYLQIAEEKDMFDLNEALQCLAWHVRGGSNDLLYTTKCWSPTRGQIFDRVKARRLLATKRVVGFVGGVLMSRKRHMELNHPHPDDCLAISADWLASIGYGRGPDLVICSHTHKNYSSIIRFPADAIAKTQQAVATVSTKQTEKQGAKGKGKAKGKRKGASSAAAASAASVDRPKPVQANIKACLKPCVVVDRKNGVLYAVLVCTMQILKNHELLMVRDLNRWSSDSHRMLTYSARRCHWLHARVGQAETALLRYVMDRMGRAKDPLLTGQAAKEFLEEARAQISELAQKAQKGAGTAKAAAKNAKDASARLPLKPIIDLLLRDDVMPDGARAHQMLRGFDVPFSIGQPKDPFVPQHPSVCFEQANCYHIKRSQLLHCEKGGDLERQLHRLPDCLPSYISADHHRQMYSVDERHLKYILEHGADWSQIQIGEIVDLSNPVRLFTVPPQPAYGVFAKKGIPLGMMLFTYAGMIGRENDQEIDSQYLYGIPRADVQVVMPDHNLPEDLFLDAKTYGNVGRFVNDNRFRRLSYDDLENLVNLETRWVFYQGQTHFVYYATRPIKEGEELITRYGDKYWQQMDQILAWYLETYAMHAGWRRDLLFEMCKSLGIAVNPPPLAMETTGAMQAKPIPYSHRMRAMDVDSDDQRRKDLQRDSILNDSDDGIELKDHDEDQIELKSFITRVRSTRHTLQERRENHQRTILTSLRRDLSMQRQHHGELQYLVQLSSHVYPTWYYAAGLSADLKAELAAFDAKCDALLDDGQSLPSPPPMPVPNFVPRKPTIVDKPEEVPDEPDPSSDEDEDPNYDPRAEMDIEETKSKQTRKRGSSDGSKKDVASSHQKKPAVKPSKPPSSKRKTSRK